MIQWCRYVLDGIEHDPAAIQQLNDPQTVLDEVHVPVLDHAHRSGALSGRDVAVLARVAGLESARARDIEDLLRVTPTACSQCIRKVPEQGLIQRTGPKARSYCIKLVPRSPRSSSSVASTSSARCRRSPGRVSSVLSRQSSRPRRSRR
ncbi:MAG: winged helix DNA-binding protein [Actinomycetota bacterium]